MKNNCMDTSSVKLRRLHMRQFSRLTLLGTRFGLVKLCLSVETARRNCQESPAVAAHRRDWFIPRVPGSHPTHLGGARFIAWLTEASLQGNANGARGIFIVARRVWTTTLCLVPIKNDQVPYSRVSGPPDKYLHTIWLKKRELKRETKSLLIAA